MTILNIHGYNGSKFNTNFDILDDAGYTICSPQLYYNEVSPEYVEETLIEIVKENDVDLIVATSFGSFFGKIVSSKCNIPLVAANPCLRPDVTFKQIATDYLENSDNLGYIKKNIENNKKNGYKGDTFIVGNMDTVVEPDLTYSEASDAEVIIFYGGHRPNRSEYESILLEAVKKFDTEA